MKQKYSPGRPKSLTLVKIAGYSCHAENVTRSQKMNRYSGRHFVKMSDSYLSIVPVDVTPSEVKQLFQKTFDWLTEKEIISPNPTDCILSGTPGYKPGSRYKDIVDGDDFGLLQRQVNGLEIVTERQVFDCGENGLDEVNCPECRANNLDSEWAEAIEAWWRSTGYHKLKCNQCGKESPIIDYEFIPTWAFGDFGLKFWNWPVLKDSFFDDLKIVMDKDVKVVYGRL